MGVVYFSIIPTFEPSRYCKCWIVCFYDKQHLEEYVSDIEELFEVWRYNFEYEKKTSHYSFVLEYARALKTECERILLEKELLPN